MKTALCIPTLNAAEQAPLLLESIAAQTLQPDSILVIDSQSEDDTVEIFRRAGAIVHSIERRSFNHGGTRQLGVDMLDAADIIMFVTQDAIPANRESFARVVACFANIEVAAAYGRQLPRRDAGHIEAHARLFNYPAVSRTTGLEDRAKMGLKSAFISNSFAAYRRSDLLAAGGFPSNVIMGEDTCVAAKMLLSGKKIAYCAGATVYHSHNYSMSEEFRRYFDTGVLHSREPWIRGRFGNAEGEGSRFVLSEISYLWQRNPFLIPSSMVRTGLKYLGFRMGLNESMFPVRTKRRLSLFRNFWEN